MKTPEQNIHSHAESNERGQEFLTACGTGVQLALAEIGTRFEKNEVAESNLAYHNSEHTKCVIDTADTILQSVGADIHERALGRLIAAFHDIVQEYEVVDGMRKRNVSNNEQRSYETLAAYMDSVNEDYKMNIFSDADKRTAEEAIMGTVPDFVDGKVMQQNLDNQTTKIARAISLADLSATGMSPEQHLQDGNEVFREENIDITTALQHPDSLSDSEKAHFKERMLAWSKAQISFAKGRKETFENDIDFAAFTEKDKESLRELFDKFDLSAEEAAALHNARMQMTFEELAESFGYAETQAK